MALRSGVTLVTPTIPPRVQHLKRAMSSVLKQERKFSDWFLIPDINREGAGPTRTKGMRAVATEWTAFLDDDDELYPNHLEVLIHAAIDHHADLVYPWFDVGGGTDPFPQFEGKEFDPAEPNMFPVTVLARTEVLQASSGFPLAGVEGDDWPLWQELVSMGVHIHHVPVRTWRWWHNSGNTSGLPDKWPKQRW